MKAATLLLVTCLITACRVQAQDIDGLKPGMTKDVVCAFVQAHAGYAITTGNCPNLEDFVTVSIGYSDSSIRTLIKLALVKNVVQALWTDIPEADFDKLSKQLTASYGSPEFMVEMRAGSADIYSGPAKLNKQGTFSPDPGKAQSVPFPGGGVANFSNYYLVWRKRKTSIFLERQNKEVSGQMTGWYALMGY
jgi:hypothetical protein